MGSCISLLMVLALPSIVPMDPEVQMVDGKLNIQAEAVTLKQFLQALDAATGMNSKVSPQLANEKISVRLTGVDLNTAIRKSFQGQPWNYVVAVGKGISVIDRAQAVAATGTGTSSPERTARSAFNSKLKSRFFESSPSAPVPYRVTMGEPIGRRKRSSNVRRASSSLLPVPLLCLSPAPRRR
jgi:hypothetical protein